MPFSGIIFFALLCIGICGAVFVGIACLNIFTKSYKPRNTVFILTLILMLFLVNGILAALTIGRLSTAINDLSTPSTTQRFIY